MTTMRLAFINNLYPPYVVGGNEMLCDEVVGSLRARGHHVSVLCGRGRRLPAPAALGSIPGRPHPPDPPSGAAAS
jgi:hypothetical protein